MNNNSCCNKENLRKSFKGSVCCGVESEFKVTDMSKVEDPINPKKTISNLFLKKIEKEANELGIVNVGYAKVSKEVFENHDNLNYSNAIVFTIPISMNIINKESSLEAQKLNDNLYKKFGDITYQISDKLRSNGFQTQVAHPKESLIDLTNLAQKAKIGYIGKSGLLISPELGSRLKISAILTSIENLPFSENNSHKWIEKYCNLCNKCIRKCPNEALVEKKDFFKAELIEKECIGCNQGCTLCIENCPFYEIGYNKVKLKLNKFESKIKESEMI